MASVREGSPEKQLDWSKVKHVLQETWSWAYRLRSVLLALPVVISAIILAINNATKLPEIVGINMQTNGEYAMAITRSVAVMGPLALTAVCLLLMFCSKRVLYPWLISLFSLILPLVFLFTSTFP